MDRQTKLLKTTVDINVILLGLFCIHLLLHADIKFYCVCYNEDFVKARFCSIPFTEILARLKKIGCYTKDFVILEVY